MAAPTLSLSVRLQNALCQPVLQLRIEETARVLNESSSKDASVILRSTVESIFGLNGQVGWNLRTITRSALPREFDQLRVFLGASGPLLSLAYRLANDPFMGFEFPVAWLPARSRSEIEEGTPSAFYANKVQNPGPGKPPTNILLNAFEYYMFQFCQFLVGVNSQRWSLSWSTAGDALYPTLLEDYLTAFLPCDNTIPPGPASPPVSPRGVLSPVAQHSPQPTTRGANPNVYLSSLVSPMGPLRSPPGPPHHHHHHSYLRVENVVGPGSSIVSPVHHLQHHHQSPHHHHTMHHHHHNPNPQLNIWTSQILVQVMMEMWVNQCLPPPTRSPTTRLLHHHHHHHHHHHPASPTPTSQSWSPHVVSVFSEHIPVDYRPNWHTGANEVVVPSSDHVRVVRMVVKHLHFFTNSSKAAHSSPLDNLRKNVWSLYRKSLYQFLCHTFSHWPLDSSFRLVLETWLSYIQPWRYTNFTTTVGNLAIEADMQRVVEGRWQGFVAENLLFYSVLFNRLACRLFRLDLSAPRNAQILFRVTKVFSQTNLSLFIREIEEALEDPHLVQRSLLSPSSTTTSTSGTLHSDPFSSRSLATVARAQVLEMEGPTHVYVPMFGQGNVTMIESLMKYIRIAYDAVYSEQQQQQQQSQSGAGDKGHKEGWFGGLIRSLFESTVTNEDETTAEDIRKTVTHLDIALKQLSLLFNILLPLGYSSEIYGGVGGGVSGISPPLDNSTLHQHSTLDTLASPHHATTPAGPVLSNFGRHQLMSGMKRRDLKYEGDPDLKPICTYEVPFLVRWLYALTLIFNKRYGSVLSALYQREDPLGWLSRSLLQPPETIHEYHKDLSLSPSHSRRPRQLPPRLTLRFLASKQVIGYELACGLLLYMVGLWGVVVKSMVTLTLLTLLVTFLTHRYFLRPQINTAEEEEEEEDDEQELEREWEMRARERMPRTLPLNRSPAQ